MTPLRPYLARALIEWINSNDMRPHVLVDATIPGTQVPSHAVKDGRIVLNLSPTATQHLVIDDYQISFQARFGGRAMVVALPMESLVSIYAQESGAGMNLPPEIPGATASDTGPTQPETPPPPQGKKPRPNHLRVVK